MLEKLWDWVRVCWSVLGAGVWKSASCGVWTPHSLLCCSHQKKETTESDFQFFLYYWWTDGEAISSREANAEFRKVNLRFWWVKTHYHEKLQKSDYACCHVNLDKPVFRDEKHVNASSRLWFHALKQSMCSIKGDCICYCLLSDIHFPSIIFFLLIQLGGGLETITGTKLHPGDQRVDT